VRFDFGSGPVDIAIGTSALLTIKGDCSAESESPICVLDTNFVFHSRLTHTALPGWEAFNDLIFGCVSCVTAIHAVTVNGVQKQFVIETEPY
jgi:hypothetical protein